MFNLRSFCTAFLQDLFGLPFGLAASTLYSIHLFTQSLSSFLNTCPYYCSLFCYSTEIMSSNPSLSFHSLLRALSFSLMPHIHLTILISARWSATSFSFLSGQILLYDVLLTQLLYSLPLIIMIYPYWLLMVPTAWIYSIQFKFWPT